MNNRYNYISPQGRFISKKWFNSKADADLFLTHWLESFKDKGYYNLDINGEKKIIPFYQIESFCTYIEA